MPLNHLILIYHANYLHFHISSAYISFDFQFKPVENCKWPFKFGRFFIWAQRKSLGHIGREHRMLYLEEPQTSRRKKKVVI